MALGSKVGAKEGVGVGPTPGRTSRKGGCRGVGGSPGTPSPTISSHRPVHQRQPSLGTGRRSETPCDRTESWGNRARREGLAVQLGQAGHLGAGTGRRLVPAPSWARRDRCRLRPERGAQAGNTGCEQAGRPVWEGRQGRQTWTDGQVPARAGTQANTSRDGVVGEGSRRTWHPSRGQNDKEGTAWSGELGGPGGEWGGPEA